MPAMGAMLASYLPPPLAATGTPSDWGQADALRTLLERVGTSLYATDVHSVTLRFSDPPAAADVLIRTAGHVLAQRDELVAGGRWSALQQDMTAFVERNGVQDNGRVVLRLDYLLALAGQPRLR